VLAIEITIGFSIALNTYKFSCITEIKQFLDGLKTTKIFFEHVVVGQTG
jgi:hypothetical protein